MGRLLERLKAEYPEAAEEVERFAPAILHVVPETMEQFLAGAADRATAPTTSWPPRWG